MTYEIKERAYEAMYGSMDELSLGETDTLEEAIDVLIENSANVVYDADTKKLYQPGGNNSYQRPLKTTTPPADSVKISRKAISRSLDESSSFVTRKEYVDNCGFPGFIETLIVKK